MSNLFELGRVVVTPAAMNALLAVSSTGSEYLIRHQSGDWGDIGEEDAESNSLSTFDCGMILSAYTLSDGTKLWVITDPGHEVTTLLLPSDY